MKRILFVLFLFIGLISLLFLFNDRVYAQACLSCPDKPTLGSGVLVTNNGFDPANCPLTQDQCCAYSFSGQDYYYSPVSQTCTTTETCDPKAGCINSGSPPPSSCAQSGNYCYTNSDCGNGSSSACSQYYCMSGGYQVSQGTMGTCQYMSTVPPTVTSCSGLLQGAYCGASCPNGTLSGATDCTGTTTLCCKPNTAASSTNQFQWGGWGTTPNKASLLDLSNILGVGHPTNASTATWEKVLSTLISLLFYVSLVIGLAFLILGGVNWLISGGDKQKLTQARQHIIFAVVGLGIVFVSALILQVLGKFLGVNLLFIP